MRDNCKKGNLDLKIAIAFICLGILVIIFMPMLLTKESIFPLADFSTTGQIGDTIGGITAPFLSLVGSVLVFLALKSQIRANQIIEDQRKKDNEAKNLNQLFHYINENVNNFTFVTLPKHHLHNADEEPTELSGARAFYKLFDQVVSKFHEKQEDLDTNPSIIELFDILKSISDLISQIEDSEAPNSKLLKDLIHQLFFYKITARVTSLNEGDLGIFDCEECKKQHGTPKWIKNLIIQIRESLLKLAKIQLSISIVNFNFPTPDSLNRYDSSSYNAAMDEILRVNEKCKSSGQIRIKDRGRVQGVPLFINSNVKEELLKNKFIESIEMTTNQDYKVIINNFELPKYGITQIGPTEEI